MGNKIIAADTYRIMDEEINSQELRKAIVSPGIDLVIFTSPASVRNFYSVTRGEPWEKIVGKLTIAAVGPLTAKEAIFSGLNPTIIPERFTVSCLITEIVKKFGQETGSFKESDFPLDQANLI